MTANSDAFVTELIKVNLPLAGRCAAQPDVIIAAELKTELQRILIERTQDPKVDLRARIAAGLALGELGNPRFEHCQGPEGEYLLPPLIMIPGGIYQIGSDEGLYDNEAPVHAVELESFLIGQFPVTNAEWALFMKAGGYEDERWWVADEDKAWWRGESTAEGPKRQWRENRQLFQEKFDQIRVLHQQGRITSKQADDWEQIAQMSDDEFEEQLDQWYPSGRQTQPAYWNDDAFNNPVQPVVGISWHEARAYCVWLSAQTGQPFRLPTEAEWEAAARGTEIRRYAYGDDFDAACCNTFETHIRHTTPTGVFPGGKTPEGLVDMTGNTYDWTSSLDQSYPYDATNGRENPLTGDGRRVVRGGSWADDPEGARAAFRFWVVPYDRGYDVGLRVACLAPILER
jgi:formylglycine-generating enzyme required for sulfatase activity